MRTVENVVVGRKAQMASCVARLGQIATYADMLSCQDFSIGGEKSTSLVRDMICVLQQSHRGSYIARRAPRAYASSLQAYYSKFVQFPLATLPHVLCVQTIRTMKQMLHIRVVIGVLSNDKADSLISLQVSLLLLAYD